jgi:hypothetical protein
VRRNHFSDCLRDFRNRQCLQQQLNKLLCRRIVFPLLSRFA